MTVSWPGPRRGTRESLLRGSTSPSAFVYTTYAYDALSRPAGVSHALSGGAAYNVWAGFAHNPAGQVAAETRDNDAGKRVRDCRSRISGGSGRNRRRPGCS